MRLNKFILVSSLCLLVWVSAQAQDKLAHLESWAGKYPSVDGKPLRTFFRLPEVRQPLLKSLGQNYYNRLLSEYSVESQIEILDNCLIITMCKAHFCPDEYVIVAVDLSSNAIHIGFWSEENTKKGKSKLTRFSTYGDYSDLPDNVLKRFPEDLDFQAMEQALLLWRAKITQCGDTYITQSVNEPNTFIEFRGNVQIHIRPTPLTEADILNGVEWKGNSSISGIRVWRRYQNGKWSEWVDGDPFGGALLALALRQVQGRWTLNARGNVTQTLSVVRCSDIPD